ncbi:MAG: hypothetical protein KDD01_18125, partial [Phaeodactylibacter sp.]|nr:hypothetical protein [Phaeodactylibacter sp.]
GKRQKKKQAEPAAPCENDCVCVVHDRVCLQDNTKLQTKCLYLKKLTLIIAPIHLLSGWTITI